MLQKVTGKNFMSYREFEVELSSGVNVFIGTSDAGKSAIFQLIEWIRTNRPLGEAFRSEWGGVTEGKIWTTDEQTVQRVKKSDKENWYQINNHKPLKAFGQNPPEEVGQILMLDEINIQKQDETPFLLGKPFWSPGEVAKKLNQAASLEDIDTATSNLTKGYRRASQETESIKDTLEEQNRQLKRYENLPDIEDLIIELEHLERHRNTLSIQRNTLYNLSQELRQVKVRLEKTVDVAPAKKLLQDAEKLNTEREKLVEEYNRLEELYEDILRVQEAIRGSGELLKVLQREYDKLVPDECPLCGSPMKGYAKSTDRGKR